MMLAMTLTTRTVAHFVIRRIVGGWRVQVGNVTVVDTDERDAAIRIIEKLWGCMA